MFIVVGQLRNPALPVTNDLLGGKIFPARLRPVTLDGRKLRRLPQVMLNQAILQLELQKLYIATLKLPLQTSRTEIDQRPQVRVIV